MIVATAASPPEDRLLANIYADAQERRDRALRERESRKGAANKAHAMGQVEVLEQFMADLRDYARADAEERERIMPLVPGEPGMVLTDRLAVTIRENVGERWNAAVNAPRGVKGKEAWARSCGNILALDMFSDSLVGYLITPGEVNRPGMTRKGTASDVAAVHG